MAKEDHAIRTIVCRGCNQEVTDHFRTTQVYCSRRCYLEHKPVPTGWNGSDEERFWRYVDKSSECWIWLNSRTATGYGRPFFRGRRIRAHRASWELHYGDIPNASHVLHHCDNPPCVRPQHLFLGTPKDNFDDMISKGRTTIDFVRGPKAKLTEDQVRAIKALCTTGKHMYKEIAKLYNLHPSSVSAIARGVTWSRLFMQSVRKQHADAQ